MLTVFRIHRSVIYQYFLTYESRLLKERKANRLRRKRFWAAGNNDMTVVDQHDKWKYKLGLALHIGLDPFNGYIKLLKVWWNNSNPKVISSYFLGEI